MRWLLLFRECYAFIINLSPIRYICITSSAYEMSHVAIQLTVDLILPNVGNTVHVCLYAIVNIFTIK